MNKFLFIPSLFLLFQFRLLSLPEGSEAMTEGGSFSRSGSEMIITAPDNSIFHHKKFDVAPNETVRFDQPSSQSRVLNRVVGTGAQSNIQGKIIADGSVYLVNPAGVVFGSRSTVEVGRLHVVAGSLTDDNFKAQIDKFESLAGEVRNDGEINAQSVSFSGARVVNNGQIYASEGYIVLAEGEGYSSSLTITSGAGSESLKLVDSKGEIAVNVVSSDGTPSTMITDLGGQALLQTGILEASHIELHGKSIQADGAIKGDTVRIVPRESAIQSSSVHKVEAQKLYIEQGPSSSEYSSSQPKVDLLSSTNELPAVSAAGSFSKLSIRSKSTMEVSRGSLAPSTSPPSLSVGEVDFRVYEGDLRVKNSIQPLSTSSSSTLRLAASKKIFLDQPSSSYPFTTREVYGQSFIEVAEEFTSITNSFSLSKSRMGNVVKRRSHVMEMTEESAEIKKGTIKSFAFSPASLIGGDFSIFAKAEGENSFLNEPENDGTVVAEKSPSPMAGIAATIQFSPITMPLLSPMASAVLDRALSNDVESSLQPYIK